MTIINIVIWITNSHYEQRKKQMFERIVQLNIRLEQNNDYSFLLPAQKFVEEQHGQKFYYRYDLLRFKHIPHKLHRSSILARSRFKDSAVTKRSMSDFVVAQRLHQFSFCYSRTENWFVEKKLKVHSAIQKTLKLIFSVRSR